MPDFLLTRDWKAVLKKSENRSVKKTGISETLDDYASGLKKNDTSKMLSALERLKTTAEQVKRKFKDHDTVVTFLDGSLKAARARQQELAKQVDDRDDDDENESNSLGKALARVKKLGEDKAWHFVLVPGKPSPGFVISKKPPKKKELNAAFEMRGKRSVFFVGRAFFESGKYILKLEDKPVPGLAKAAKRAAQIHAEANIKVIVRGAGVDLEDDADIEPTGGEDDAPAVDQGRYEAFQARLAKVSTAVDKFETSANAKVDGASDGVRGAINMLLGQVEKDDTLGQDEKLALNTALTDLMTRVDVAAQPDPVDPGAKYPTLAQWEKLIEGLVRLDPSRREDAQKRLLAKIAEVRKQVQGDDALVNPRRGEINDILRQAIELLKNALESRDSLAEAGEDEENADLAKRIMGIERRYDQMLKTPGLDTDRVEKVGKAFKILRKVFAEGKLDPDDMRITRVEDILEDMAKRAFGAQQDTKKSEGHEQMHAALKPAMTFMKRAMIPTGLIKDPQAIRDAAPNTPELAQMLTAMNAATNQPGEASGAAMEKAARDLMTKAGADSDLGQLATEVLARATMMQMVAEYDNLGDPPWGPAQADIASELQAQLFFLEGAITGQKANYEAPDLGGDGGASESWWIERQEIETPGEPTKGKKQYIFKPSSREAAVMAGLPVGSGAPREVLAKRLDELMAGAGFDIGVSPTTLANIDASHLATMDPGDGSMMGSMQQLAPADGALADKTDDFAAFSENIDKKSFDDVAVFDMIFANLDRHAANMLFATDPETGKAHLVPIDHGSALPDPEALYGNRNAIGPDVNIMANPDMVPARSPLGEETVEALLRLDADQMVADMKQSRTDMANRHEAADGMISDAAIEAMGARVRFVQAAAAAKVPVAEIFELLAIGALTIANTAPDGMGELLTELREQKAEYAKAKDTIEEVADVLVVESGQRDAMAQLDAVKSLGWGSTFSKSGMAAWFDENPKLIARIIQTQMENPKLREEIERLRPIALQNDPDIERKVTRSNLLETYNQFSEAALGNALKMPANDTTLDALKQEFEQLGGKAALTEANRVFPPNVAQHMKEPSGSDDDIRYAWIDRVALLRQWAAFNNEGGMPEILRLGGSMPREDTIKSGVLRLSEMKLNADTCNTILEMTDERAAEINKAKYDELVLKTGELLGELCQQATKDKLTGERAKAQEEWEEGRNTAAVALLARANKVGDQRLANEQKLIAECNQLKIEYRAKVDELLPPAKDSIEEHLPTILGTLDTCIDTCVLKHKIRATNEFSAPFDAAQAGDDSDLHKMQVATVDNLRRLAEHDGMPWYDGLKVRVDSCQELLDIFDVKKLVNDQKRLTQAIDAMDLLRAALGNTAINDAPDAVIELGAEWGRKVQFYGAIDKAPSAADRIRELLSENE